MTRRRWKPETRREVVMQLRAEGKTLREIARHLDVDKATVCRDINAWLSHQVSQCDSEMRQANATGKVTP